MPAISVIMPVYNTAAYLHESIESILIQTFEYFEFIIINDGSSDNSEEIILSYKDPRIKYLKNETNKGYVFSLNRALKIATGKYIARLDSDDLSLPERLKTQYNFMENHPQVIVCGCAFESIGAIEKELAFKKDFLLSLLTSQFQHSSVFFRHDYFKTHGLEYDEKSSYYEDYKIWAEIFVRNGYRSDCFHNLPEKLIKYRVHPYQVSSRFRVEQYMGSMKVRRKFFTDFLNYFKINFTFSDDSLQITDIRAIEKIFSKFNHHQKLREYFSLKALEEFKALALYWLYISYPKTSVPLFARFMSLHGLNKEITFEEKTKVFLHLALGKEYKRRF